MTGRTGVVLNLPLTASPDAFPLTLDPSRDAVYLVDLDEAAYNAASFLDERLGRDGVWRPWTEVEGAAASLTAEADFIFHIGHVGSTLLSRLLGASPAVFSVREPAALRTLAQMHLDLGRTEGQWTTADFERRLGGLLSLYARVYRPSQRSLIKATSFVGEISTPMLQCFESARAILMFVPPATYMATILAGSDSPSELRFNAPSRLQRLHHRLRTAAWRLSDFSIGELTAMAWTSEVCALADTAGRFPTRTLWLNFEDFLARPGAGLGAALRHLHGEASADVVSDLLSSPDFGRYSKATEHPYDAAVRREVLSASRRDNAAELAKGMAWLNAAGRAYPLVADAVRAVASAPSLA